MAEFHSRAGRAANRFPFLCITVPQAHDIRVFRRIFGVSNFASVSKRVPRDGIRLQIGQQAGKVHLFLVATQDSCELCKYRPSH